MFGHVSVEPRWEALQNQFDTLLSYVIIVIDMCHYQHVHVCAA